MHQRTQARQGAGIPATKYRAADAGCRAREESSFSPKGETNTCVVSPAPEGATRGLLRRRQRGGTRENETSRAGLRPDGVYVYAERSQGRANRPFLAGEHRCGEASRTMSGKPACTVRNSALRAHAKFRRKLPHLDKDHEEDRDEGELQQDEAHKNLGVRPAEVLLAVVM